MKRISPWVFLALCILALCSCGEEPAPVAIVHEVCTVVMGPDGVISCTCEKKP